MLCVDDRLFWNADQSALRYVLSEWCLDLTEPRTKAPFVGHAGAGNVVEESFASVAGKQRSRQKSPFGAWMPACENQTMEYAKGEQQTVPYPLAQSYSLTCSERRLSGENWWRSLPPSQPVCVHFALDLSECSDRSLQVAWQVSTAHACWKVKKKVSL